MATIKQSFICRENAVRVSTTQYTIANQPNPNTDQVFVNGVLQNAGVDNDYTLSGTTINFNRNIESDEVVLVNYLLDVIEQDQQDTEVGTTNYGRTELIHWCLRKLGAPVIEINVDDEQIEDRIDEALMYFRDYHFDGVERMYLHHQITASRFKLTDDFSADITRGVTLTGQTSGATATAYDKSVDNREIRFKSLNKIPFKVGEVVSVDGSTETFTILEVILGDIDNGFIPVGTKVISVTNVLPQQKATIGGNFGGMFDFQYQFALHNMFNLASTDLVTYDIYQRYMSTWEFMFRGTKGIRFNRKTDRLFLDVQDLVADQYLVIEAWAALNAETYKEVYMDEFVREYAYSLIKQQWGSNLKKFSGVQLPGGITLNGQAIYDEAKQELEELRERVKKEFQLPPDFLVG
jgi:hypothetical protein